MTDSRQSPDTERSDHDSDVPGLEFGIAAVTTFALLTFAILAIAVIGFVTRKTKPNPWSEIRSVENGIPGHRMTPLVTGRVHHRPLRKLEGMAASLTITTLAEGKAGSDGRFPAAPVLASYQLNFDAKGRYRSVFGRPAHSPNPHPLKSHAGERLRFVLRLEPPFGAPPLEAVTIWKLRINHGAVSLPFLVPTPVEPLLMGRVLDQDGRPLHGATLRCRAMPKPRRQRNFIDSVFKTWVREDGGFRFYPREGYRRFSGVLQVDVRHPSLTAISSGFFKAGQRDIELRAERASLIALPKIQVSTDHYLSLEPSLITLDGDSVKVRSDILQNRHVLYAPPGQYRLQYRSQHDIVEFDAGIIELNSERLLDLSRTKLRPTLHMYSFSLRSREGQALREVTLRAPAAGLGAYDPGVYRCANDLTILAETAALDIRVESEGFRPAELRVPPGRHRIELVRLP
jgi:hypothetical protein